MNFCRLDSIAFTDTADTSYSWRSHSEVTLLGSPRIKAKETAQLTPCIPSEQKAFSNKSYPVRKKELLHQMCRQQRRDTGNMKKPSKRDTCERTQQCARNRSLSEGKLWRVRKGIQNKGPQEIRPDARGSGSEKWGKQCVIRMRRSAKRQKSLRRISRRFWNWKLRSMK